MKLTQLTDTELKDKLRTCAEDEVPAILKVMAGRIKAKNSQPHEEECICTDCTYQD